MNVLDESLVLFVLFALLCFVWVMGYGRRGGIGIGGVDWGLW
jgi:hypothetical protein